MVIHDTDYSFNGGLTKRDTTKSIILHHRAGDGDMDSLHRTHLANGWAGVGYHFYIRKNGDIFRGRPIDTVGAHATGHNYSSIGICFEGNYQTYDNMPLAQVEAGAELIAYVKSLYPGLSVKKHSDVTATACPGRHFKFDDIINSVNTHDTDKLVTANDIAWELSQTITIYDMDGFVKALEQAKQQNSPLYWGFRKIVNK